LNLLRGAAADLEVRENSLQQLVSVKTAFGLKEVSGTVLLVQKLVVEVSLTNFI